MDKDIETIFAAHVYSAKLNGKVELIIANKDFTHFRTLDQYLHNKGSISVIDKGEEYSCGQFNDRFYIGDQCLNSCWGTMVFTGLGTDHHYGVNKGLKELKKLLQNKEDEQNKNQNRLEF